ncbi:MAG TPA: hypothetical protein VEJ63_20305 [Planctomycetota bacterium]|nr:hypothetical protein [Planctomycetota bacterium]
MPQYVIKVLVDVEARDDIQARQMASALVQNHLSNASGIREIVLHAKDDNKSIKMNPDGTYVGQWNKGGQKS